MTTFVRNRRNNTVVLNPTIYRRLFRLPPRDYCTFNAWLQLSSLRLRDGLLDGLDAFCMHSTACCNDTLVGFESPTLRKVKRLAMHVGADTAGFGDEEGTGSVVLFGPHEYERWEVNGYRTGATYPNFFIVWLTASIFGWNSQT